MFNYNTFTQPTLYTVIPMTILFVVLVRHDCEDKFMYNKFIKQKKNYIRLLL